MINVLVDAIIEDVIIDARELNLIKFIDLYIHNISNKKEQDLLKKSMDAFLSDCLIKSNKSISLRVSPLLVRPAKSL